MVFEDQRLDLLILGESTDSREDCLERHHRSRQYGGWGGTGKIDGEETVGTAGGKLGKCGVMETQRTKCPRAAVPTTPEGYSKMRTETWQFDLSL